MTLGELNAATDHKRLKLVQVDHSKIEYPPFSKQFYVEVPEIARMTKAGRWSRYSYAYNTQYWPKLLGSLYHLARCQNLSVASNTVKVNLVEAACIH